MLGIQFFLVDFACFFIEKCLLFGLVIIGWFGLRVELFKT